VSQRKIVVGYDGSVPATRAARWALDEASRVGAPVEFCYGCDRPAHHFGWEFERVVEDILEEAALDAAATHPTVDVDTDIARGPAHAVLAHRSANAGLVVVGSRGRARSTGPFGAMASTVSLYASCPVVVVRGRSANLAPVVVGVDDSESAQLALTFAFDQAAARGVALHAVRAWLPPKQTKAGPSAVDAVLGAEWRSLADLVEQSLLKYPAVKATHEVVVGHPAQAMLQAATPAQLVVVGTRGQHAFRGTLLGSVSQHLLRNAETSVAVVRDIGGDLAPASQ
jgi:nucleotide-binding universal stress UspA family protein